MLVACGLIQHSGRLVRYSSFCLVQYQSFRLPDIRVYTWSSIKADTKYGGAWKGLYYYIESAHARLNIQACTSSKVDWKGDLLCKTNFHLQNFTQFAKLNSTAGYSGVGITFSIELHILSTQNKHRFFKKILTKRFLYFIIISIHSFIGLAW